MRRIALFARMGIMTAQSILIGVGVALAVVAIVLFITFRANLIAFLEWLWRRVWAVLSIVLTALVTAVLAILVGIYPDKWKWLADTLSGRIILGLSAAMIIAAQVLTLRDSECIADLRKQLGDERKSGEVLDAENGRLRDDNRALFVLTLRALAESLSFKYDERITVFEYTERGFESVGRYSINRDNTKPGRSICPKNQGIIGKAWAGEHAFIDDLPNSATHLDLYCSEVERQCEIPKEVVQGFKMKSRCLFAHCILDALGDGPVAVIVFESLTPGRLNKDLLIEAIHSDEYKIKYYLEQRRTAPLPVNGKGLRHG